MAEKILLKFPAQLHSFRKTTIGDNLITFTIDREYSDQIVDIIRKEIGTEFITYLEEVTAATNLSEDAVELKTKFYKKFHVLIGELADMKGIDREKMKETLKKQMIEDGRIKESTKELSVKGLAQACNKLEEIINGTKKI